VPFTVRLARVALRYRGGATLHTATSGVVAGMDELRLVLRQDGALAGLGASRVNIAYLTGIDPEDLVAEAMALCATINWRAAPDLWVASADQATAPVRMLIEMAARDAAARRAGHSLAEHFGGKPAVATPTNQTLFWCDEPTLRLRVEGFVARGYSDLKLRVGIGSVAEDLQRLALVREIAGPDATLSVDANGTWSREQAHSFLFGARPLRLAYY
jgi:L-alanine-DL-glutamate epimerase-like enolase superfamily enzyme